MKKRLLALILCLVMVASLLPITAAATEYHLNSLKIKASGVVKGSDGSYHVMLTGWEADCDEGKIDSSTYGALTVGGTIYTTQFFSDQLTNPPVEDVPYYITFSINKDLDIFRLSTGGSVTLEIPGYITEMFSRHSPGGPFRCGFKLTKVHEHNWQLTQTENTLTVECGNNGCPIRKMSVELKANSVTLPDSPFNARLEGWEQLVSEFPNAKRKFEYKYRGPGDSEYHLVDPIAANAKAGEYQVGVYLWDITRGPIDPSEGTYLYVKYTAADPAITAQTGDNRPIELMMAGVAIFSALAAAAFVLDSKRKYSR